MAHDHGGPARRGLAPARSPAHRGRAPRIRVAALGITAVFLIWTGRDVSWALLGRASALWLVDAPGVLLAGGAAAALLRSVRIWLIVAAVLLVTVLT